MKLSTVALVAGAAARLNRLVITDDLGQWWIQEPIDRALVSYAESHGITADPMPDDLPRWWKYVDGRTCPYCIGFHLGYLTLAAGVLAEKRGGTFEKAFRFGAGALSLNYVTAHIGSALGDFDLHDDDENEVL